MNPYTEVIGWDRGRLARIQDTLMSFPDGRAFPTRAGGTLAVPLKTLTISPNSIRRAFLNLKLQLLRQALINYGTRGTISNFPKRDINRARNVLHFLKVDLVD